MRNWTILCVCFYIFVNAIQIDFKYDLWTLLLVFASIPAIFSLLRHGSFFSFFHLMILVFFLTSLGISILISEDRVKSALLSVQFIPAVLIYLLIIISFTKTKDIIHLYLAVSISVFVLGFEFVYALFFEYNVGHVDWISKTGIPAMVVKNDTVFLAIMSPLCLSLACLRPFHMLGVFAVFSLLLCLLGGGIFQSRITVLTMMASLSCFIALAYDLKQGLISAIIMLLLILLIDVLMGCPLLYKFVENWNGSGRIPLWACAWEMFVESPIIGNGLHTFGEYYTSYINSRLFPSWVGVDTRFIPWPHNLYLEVLAGQGIIGMSALLIFLYRSLTCLWPLRKSGDESIRLLGVACFSSMVGFCFASLFELSFLRMWVVITIFFLSAVAMQLSNMSRLYDRRKIYE